MILLVDDDAPTLEVLTELLRMDGFETDTAAGGVEALRKLSERHYTCLVLDLLMPDLDAAEVLQEMRKRCVSVPVVLFSASPHRVREVARDFDVPYVEKPFKIEDLEQVILQHQRKPVAA